MPYPPRSVGSGGVSEEMLDERIAAIPSRPPVIVNQLEVGVDRDRDVTYTNTSGHAIGVHATSTNSTASIAMRIIIDEGAANEVTFRSNVYAGTTKTRVVCDATVPAGSTYVIRDRDPEYWVEVV